MKSKKISRKHEDLITQLQEQCDFIKTSSQAFDNGKYHEAKRIASSIRTLVHETNNSKSLIRQIWPKGITWSNTVPEYPPPPPLPPKSEGCKPHPFYFAGLVVMKMGTRKVWEKNASTLEESKWVSFQEWWEGVVLIEGFCKLSRKWIILQMANKDGGAHVDPELIEDYHKLSRNGSIGLKFAIGGKQFFPDGPHTLLARLIADEALFSIDNALNKI